MTADLLQHFQGRKPVLLLPVQFGRHLYGRFLTAVILHHHIIAGQRQIGCHTGLLGLHGFSDDLHKNLVLYLQLSVIDAVCNDRVSGLRKRQKGKIPLPQIHEGRPDIFRDVLHPADIDIAYRMVIWLLHLYGKDPVIPDQQGT